MKLHINLDNFKDLTLFQSIRVEDEKVFVRGFTDDRVQVDYTIDLPESKGYLLLEGYEAKRGTRISED